MEAEKAPSIAQEDKVAVTSQKDAPEAEKVPSDANGDHVATSSKSDGPEVENAPRDAIDVGVAAPSKEDAQEAIADLIKESQAGNQTNGKEDVSGDQDSKNETEKRKDKAEDEPDKETRPSKRVREGQRYNDRPRRYEPYNNDRPDYRKNIKSDFTSQTESSDPVAIRKQVEFYFSDSNLLQDKFLFTKIEGHENLPVPISVIHSFKRMRHFQPLSAVIEALKESTTLNVVDDDTAIQRKEPLPEGLIGKPMIEIKKVHEDQSMARSIYAKGFGEEEASTQFDIEAFFAKYGPTNSVRLRRSHDQIFKRSVFVEFDSEATQKAFLEQDPKPKWGDKELVIKSKKQYCDEKVDDIQAGKVRPNEDDYRGGRHHNGNTHGRRRRDSPDYNKGERSDDSDSRDWRVRRDEDRKSGFKDRRGGGHRGPRGSARGRGPRGGRGGRDDRGHRDRRDDDRNRDARGVPTIRSTSPDGEEKAAPPPTKPLEASKEKKDSENLANGSSEPPAAAPAATTKSGTATEASKKRIREEDDAQGEQGSAKKVDTKETES